MMRVFVFAWILLFSGSSYAQTSQNEIHLNMSQESVEEKGEVLFFVFDQKQAPVSGFEIHVSNQTYFTNQDGYAKIQISSGHKEFFFPKLKQNRKINVLADLESEIIINLLPELPNSIFEISEPEALAVQDLPEVQTAQGEAVLFALRSGDKKSLSKTVISILGYAGVVSVDSSSQATVFLPEGSYRAVISEPNYRTVTKDFVVKPEQKNKIDVLLEPRDTELEDFVILMPQNKGSMAALLEVRRKASAVSEVLGAEQMSRQGDSDAASSLRRVTGLTLMGGKYVYVRGLGERYSAVQLNGLSLPSPEPSRRVVPLDLFPTAILESVVIQKSFSPELPAEFGGGLVLLQTRSLPNKFFGKISLSQNIQELGEFNSYSGGTTDWWGQDDGGRAMPTSIKSALLSGRKLVEQSASNPKGFSKEELRNFGDALRKNYDLYSYEPTPLPNLTMALGDKWEWGEWDLGSAASFLYSSGYDTSDKETASLDAVTETEFAVTEKGFTQESEVERKKGGSVDLGLKFKDQQNVMVNVLTLHDSSDSVSTKDSSGSGVNEFAKRRTRTEWVQRSLDTQQARGEHQLGLLFNRPVRMLWKFGAASAQREAPDSKEYTYKKHSSEDPYKLDAEASGNLRTYSYLKDDSLETGLEIQIEPTENIKVRLGYSDLVREREADTFRLQYVKDYLAGQEPDLTRDPDTIFAENNNWILVNQTGAADSYGGQQKTQAVYLQTSWQLQPNVELHVGARKEESLQEVRTFFYYSPEDTQALGSIKSFDILPAYSLVWSPSDKIKSRTAYGETVSRPDFRELSPVRYIDEDTGYDAKGNNELKGTLIRNLDHRWEYYFATDEYVSVGGFYKKFENPIEDVFEPVAGSLLKVPRNAVSAENKGLELEGRFQLRRLHRSLRRFSFVTNYSLIDSKVKLDPVFAANLTTIDRPLQGQSPYVFNVQLQYDRESTKTSATLLYNVIGARITEVGTDYRPDIYEQPFQQLDFVASQKIGRNMSWSFKAKNLLNPKLIATQGGETVRSYNKDRSFSLGFSMTM